MAKFIETKIRYDKMHENGVVKPTTEKYLVDADSFTEAEAHIIEERTPYISGDFNVSAVKKSNVAELAGISSEGDKFYKCKLLFVSFNEKTGAEKKSASHILVRAFDFDEALSTLKEHMKGTVSDYEIAAIVETDILDVYLHEVRGI